ncbi:MAG: hypothetical protein JW804_06905 [Sedimentisphaerales bacterium]|nr:hypothetical protein [Sedimentisphaerales bacterium]
MKGVRFLLSLTFISIVLLFHPGCAPRADIALKFSPEQTVTYKAVSHSRKDYLFEQPREKKRTEKMAETIVEMVYDQTITGIDKQGNADAAIKINAIKYLSRDEQGKDIDFDSNNRDSEPKALNSLIGQTYQIKISPNGEIVEVSGLDNAGKAVVGREGSKLAKNILDKEAIVKIHTIKALPDSNSKKLSVGNFWKRDGRSPKSALVIKSFDKIYEVKKIEKTPNGMVAAIEMDAIPASSTAEQSLPSVGSMGVFGNMFESDEDFNGKLKLNLDTGKLYEYAEKFAGKYTAVQFPDNDKNAEPDMLQLGYTEIHSIEAVE